MKHKKFLLLTVLSIMICLLGICLVQCSGDNKGKKVLGKPVSAPYELLVVVDKEWLKTEAGETFKVVIESPIAGLPRPESHFRITYINPADFKGTFHFYGNVLVVNISKKVEETSIEWFEEMYCKPQYVTYLNAPDNEKFISMLHDNAKVILDRLDLYEFNRERALLQTKYSGQVLSQMRKQFGLQMRAPQDVDDIKTGIDFFWASDSKKEFRTNVCAYTVPLRDSLTLADFLAIRDSVMKINIPGGREDQWMETDSRTVSYDLWESDDKHPYMVVRGLWDMKNDAMGGPFVSYITNDYDKNRTVIVEGFVFAPEEDKRAMIRQLEAGLQTLELDEK